MFGTQEPDAYFRGAELQKVGPKKYRIINGAFSTCVQPTPRWEISSGSFTVNLDDYALLQERRVPGQGRAADVLAGLLLPDPGRRPGHRAS